MDGAEARCVSLRNECFYSACWTFRGLTPFPRRSPVTGLEVRESGLGVKSRRRRKKASVIVSEPQICSALSGAATQRRLRCTGPWNVIMFSKRLIYQVWAEHDNIARAALSSVIPLPLAFLSLPIRKPLPHAAFAPPATWFPPCFPGRFTKKQPVSMATEDSWKKKGS